MLTRTLVGAVITIVLLACLYLGDWVFIGVFTLTFAASINELDRAFRTRGRRVFIIPAYILAVTGGVLYKLTDYNTQVLVSWALLLFVATLIGQVIMTRDDFSSLPFCLIPFAYPLISYLTLYVLFFGLPQGQALSACSLAVLCPQLGDVMAYYGGTFWGKRKLCPHISPKKTVIGSLFGIVGGLTAAVVLYFLQQLWGGTVPLLIMLLLGFLCSVVGQFGDLFASCIKREAGIKDFSSVLPGHGGFLDRIDSMLLCAPMILAFFVLSAFIGG